MLYILQENGETRYRKKPSLHPRMPYLTRCRRCRITYCAFLSSKEHCTRIKYLRCHANEIVTSILLSYCLVDVYNATSFLPVAINLQEENVMVIYMPTSQRLKFHTAVVRCHVLLYTSIRMPSSIHQKAANVCLHVCFSISDKTTSIFSGFFLLPRS